MFKSQYANKIVQKYIEKPFLIKGFSKGKDLQKLENNVSNHTKDIQLIFRYVKQLLNPPNPPRRKIGFIQDDR